MPNDIPQRQNQPEFIDRIAASTRAYEIVESIGKLQTGLALVAAVAGPLTRYAYPAASGWAAFFAIGVVVFNVFLERCESKYRTLGAKIQEVFDTSLLDLPWNHHRCQSPPDHEKMNGLAASYKKKQSLDSLIDWYPVEAGSVSLEFGRFVCQRANMWWDMELRRKFAAIFYGGTALIIIAVVAVALTTNWTVSEVIVSLALPVLPLAVKLVQQGLKHSDSAKVSDRAKALLESIWHKALADGTDPGGLREDARRLQDELFDRRRSSPKVPQRFYNRYRASFERDMQAGAKEMVKQVQKKLGITPK